MALITRYNYLSEFKLPVRSLVAAASNISFDVRNEIIARNEDSTLYSNDTQKGSNIRYIVLKTAIYASTNEFVSLFFHLLLYKVEHFISLY